MGYTQGGEVVLSKDEAAAMLRDEGEPRRETPYARDLREARRRADVHRTAQLAAVLLAPHLRAPRLGEDVSAGLRVTHAGNAEQFITCALATARKIMEAADRESQSSLDAHLRQHVREEREAGQAPGEPRATAPSALCFVSGLTAVHPHAAGAPCGLERAGRLVVASNLAMERPDAAADADGAASRVAGLARPARGGGHRDARSRAANRFVD